MQPADNQKQSVQNILKYGAHLALAHSYSIYFFSFLFGIILDFIFPFNLMDIPFAFYIGIIFIIVGPAIIFWAQSTSRNLKIDDHVTKHTFQKGPYRFSRLPTNFGLAILILGFGVLMNAFFVVVFTLLSLIVTKFTFLRREEDILEKKYGAPYLEYKKSVRL